MSATISSYPLVPFKATQYGVVYDEPNAAEPGRSDRLQFGDRLVLITGQRMQPRALETDADRENSISARRSSASCASCNPRFLASSATWNQPAASIGGGELASLELLFLLLLMIYRLF